MALHLTLAVWAVLELALRVRERLQGRGSAARDRATRALIAITLGASIALAAVTASRATAPRIAGPYRWVRHPSYSGLLLIVTGFGLAVGNWLALAICAVLPLPALLRRIHVE